MLTKEQEQNLWKWCGLTIQLVSYGWRITFSDARESEFVTERPTVDLNNLFKYAVPERISEVTFMYASNCVSCDIEDLEGNFFEGHAYTESIEEAWTKSAQALALAILKIQEGK